MPVLVISSRLASMPFKLRHELSFPFKPLAVNSKTSDRVVWFSVAEAAVMLVMGVWQTLSLRAYFMQDKQRVGL